MRPRFILIAVVLPICALVATIARSEYQVRISEVWRVPITGFDALEVLRGHYIRFRLDIVEAVAIDNEPIP